MNTATMLLLAVEALAIYLLLRSGAWRRFPCLTLYLVVSIGAQLTVLIAGGYRSYSGTWYANAQATLACRLATIVECWMAHRRAASLIASAQALIPLNGALLRYLTEQHVIAYDRHLWDVVASVNWRTAAVLVACLCVFSLRPPRLKPAGSQAQSRARRVLTMPAQTINMAPVWIPERRAA